MNRCFFCGECKRWNSPLHNASTFGLDARVRKYAAVLQDENLLAKLSTGDLVAIDQEQGQLTPRIKMTTILCN